MIFSSPAFAGEGDHPQDGGGAFLSVERARALRKTMTPTERRLWNVLKLKPGGFKFRKQHPLRPYVLDFFCHEAGLAIEVDGFAHELGTNPQRDARRDAWSAAQGVKTVRVAAKDVRDNLEGVVALIIEECGARSPRRTPPPPSAVPLPSKGWGGD